MARNFGLARPAPGEIGIDEAGRGPMAGPVVAAAVALPPNHGIVGLADSKALSPEDREMLFGEIQACASVGIAVASVDRIDAMNIRGATLWAMGRALAGVRRGPVPNPADHHVLVDGRDAIPGCRLPCQAVVKGDNRHQSIAAASIVAKVVRDAIMVRIAMAYPGYDFATHKGYPTRAHKARVAEIGPCLIHRRSFKPIRDFLAGEA